MFTTVFLFISSLTALYFFKKRERFRLPPGPRGLPILGNIFQFDPLQPWHTFAKWKQIYGPIVYINLAGQPIVILNSKKVAEDLLDRRASKYSDRPRWLVGVEYLTKGLDFPLMRYNERWRKMRRASEAALGLRVSSNYHRKQADESVLLAHDILNKPDTWGYHVNRTASSTILSLVYDTPSLQSQDNPLFTFMDDFVTRTTEALLPGAHLVDTFPILDCLPDFLSKWRQAAERDFQIYTATFERMYLDIKNKFLNGMEQRPSFCATLAETESRHGMSDVESAWLAGLLYAAGQETTTTVLHWFLSAMLLFPEVQQRAHEELDKVVGRSRLPSFADMKHLPYIQGIVREVFRWRTPVPVGLPHALIEDDYYEGYFIPKGTIVFANIRSIHCDPDNYGPDADQFRPERHLDENNCLKDTKCDGHFAYGFGQRLCVGRHIANNSIFITFATILWAMRIEPMKDASGQSNMPDNLTREDPINGVFVRPPAFGFAVEPRFEDADVLIQQARDEIMREIAALPVTR